MSVTNAFNNTGRPPTLLDLSIWWGRRHIQRGESDENVALERAFQQDENRTGKTIESLLPDFESHVEVALEELRDELTIALDPDDAREAEYSLLSQHETELEELATPVSLYASIIHYLQTLDNVIYLSHAVLYFPLLKDNKVFRERALGLVERVVEECPPAYRLIPLNATRLKALKGLPENIHYLFPWYTQWSDVPVDALNLLADHLAGNPVMEMTTEDLQALWLEMETDEPLREQIVAHATTIKNTPAAMQRAFSLRWLLEAKEAESECEMPDVVVKAGMIGSAIRVAVEAILAGVSPFEWRFRAGFCGLGLTDEQRFNLLKPIELTIKASKGAKWGGPGPLIQQWLEDKLSDRALGETLLKGWAIDLEQAAQKPFIPLFSEKTIYWLLLTLDNPLSLANAIRGFDNALSLESLRDFAKVLQSIGHFESIPAGFQSLAACLASGRATLEEQALELYGQWLEALELKGRTTTTLQSFTKVLSEKLSTKLKYDSPEAFLKALKSVPTSQLMKGFVDDGDSKKSVVHRHKITFNYPPSQEDGWLSGVMAGFVSILQGWAVNMNTLAVRADSGGQQLFWAKIANVEDETISDLSIVGLEDLVEEYDGNELKIIGSLPPWLPLPNKVQWFCDWLMPDGTAVQPKILEISDERIFTALFGFEGRCEKKASHVKVDNPKGELRILILAFNLKIDEDKG